MSNFTQKWAENKAKPLAGSAAVAASYARRAKKQSQTRTCSAADGTGFAARVKSSGGEEQNENCCGADGRQNLRQRSQPWSSACRPGNGDASRREARRIPRVRAHGLLFREPRGSLDAGRNRSGSEHREDRCRRKESRLHG